MSDLPTGYEFDAEPTHEREDTGPLPVVAIVGRPNVGKSTLVNRIIGRREAVVEDTPGVTRDRVSYDANWAGRGFTLVDTGGWDPDAVGFAALVAAQAEVAIYAADAVLFVVDATIGITDSDEAVVRVLRKSGKPVVLAANKVDDQRVEAEAMNLWSLGIGEPFPISAMHGRGTGDMLDAVLAALPDAPAERDPESGGPRRVAIVGKPNVGKSSLLNKVAKEDRVVVSEISGTTVDPVDELIVLGGKHWRFIDTAGIRRKVKNVQGHEYYASLRTNSAIERAEVVVVVIDASEPMTEQDLRIMNTVEETGKALVIAYNKWDLVDEDRRYYLEREIDRDLVQFRWAPRVNISALTGRHMEKMVPAIEAALDGWQTRVPTGQLNAFLGRLVAAHPHPVRSGKQPKILFGTQATTMPPTFAIFTSGQFEPSYQRFIERRLREDFGFVGSPVHVQIRARQKKNKR
jgi:GTP-binding protein